MADALPHAGRKGFRVRFGISTAILLSACLGAGAASAYVGESFLLVPGVASGSHGAGYKSWIKFEAQYWVGKDQHVRVRGIQDLKRMFFSGPIAPRDGAGSLALALDKHSPALKGLLQLCATKQVVPEIRFAEPSDLARPAVEWGRRPASVPAYYEYALKDVTLACPVAGDAPEQGVVLNFKGINWLNYKGDGETLVAPPAALGPAERSGKTKTFVLTFFGAATDVSDKQCVSLNQGPTEQEYYALMAADAAAKEKAALAGSGGALNQRSGACFRGPDKLNVCQLPGVVRDPGHVAPQSTVANGLNLDGSTGTGRIARGFRQHPNFTSPDGRPGIDNQYFAVNGCVPGLKRNGLLTAARTELMRNGLISMIVMVSGIDDDRNDKSVDVTFLYSLDPMTKNAAGSLILPKYTYRLTDMPELTQYFRRFHGRIENGVLTTDPLDEITFFEGSMQRVSLRSPRLRLEMPADGTIKGIVGGYFDWRELYNFVGINPAFERGLGYRSPGLYEALKRSADGMQNPITGDFDGISTTYEFNGVPAFIPPSQQAAVLGQGASPRRKGH